MKFLIVGATGATGKLLVKQLLDNNHEVTSIIRSPAKLEEFLGPQKNLHLIKGNILDFSDDELKTLVAQSEGIGSCLGHNLSLKGIFGHPRKLVTEATSRLCEIAKTTPSEKPRRFVLMNTAGNSNRDLKEPISLGQSVVIGLLRCVLPPHVDNEKASDFLRITIGQKDKNVEWTVVRPDSLIDENDVSKYKLHKSPTRSAIFDPGKTSRINVAHFMAELLTNDTTWTQWKGQMPIIYNEEN